MSINTNQNKSIRFLFNLLRSVMNMWILYNVIRMKLNVQIININNYNMKCKKSNVNQMNYQKPTIIMNKNVSNQKTHCNNMNIQINKSFIQKIKNLSKNTKKRCKITHIKQKA